MSYSIDSAESSVYSSSSSVSASTRSYKAPPKQKKWVSAANWSAAFCDSIEERLACGTDRWMEEDNDEVTIIQEAPVEDETNKVEKKKKSYSFLAKYHSSKIFNAENGGERKEKDILNQFIQGNHRGWGAKSTPKKGTRKDKSQDILKENVLLSYGSTFDDTLDESQTASYSETDGETCDDTYDSRTLEYASTYDSTHDGTYDTAPEDEEESYQEPKKTGKSRTKPSVPSVNMAGLNTRSTRSSRSTFSTASSADHSGRSGRISDASRNDTTRYSNRERDSRYQNQNLERESPSFGSRNSRLLQKQPQLKNKHKNRSFGSQPSTGSSQRSTIEKSAFVVTPQKMLSTYQSSSKPTPTTTTRVKVNRESRKSQGSKNSRSSQGTSQASTRAASSKKIELGRRRATERMIKEQAKAKPKNFPYLVNHSLFHQNLANKQARAMSRQTTGQ